MGKEKSSFEKAVVTNRKAYHDYFIEEKFEAGIMLQGRRSNPSEKDA